MKKYLDKFDEEYKGKQAIEIEFFDENPLSVKYARYNQGGEVCHCQRESDTATLKVKNGWQQIKCDKYGCEYRQKDDDGKRACNRIGWLKFFIPSISTDRIFLMKITGQQSISKLDDYIMLQKLQGKSVKGKYTIFLKKSEKPNSLGKTFKNYVLDLLKSENFYSENTNLVNTSEISKQILSTNSSNNVNKDIENTGNNDVTSTHTKIENYNTNNNVTNKIESKVKTSKTATSNKTTKTTKSTKQSKEEKETIQKQDDGDTKESKQEASKKQENSNNKEEKQSNFSWDNIYLLFQTHMEKVKTKDGEKDYLIATFYDANDKKYDVLINPEYKERIQNCNLGAAVKMELKNFGNRLCAMKLEIFDEQQKIAA